MVPSWLRECRWDPESFGCGHPRCLPGLGDTPRFVQGSSEPTVAKPSAHATHSWEGIFLNVKEHSQHTGENGPQVRRTLGLTLWGSRVKGLFPNSAGAAWEERGFSGDSYPIVTMQDGGMRRGWTGWLLSQCGTVHYLLKGIESHLSVP